MAALDKATLAHLDNLEPELRRRLTALLEACPHRMGIASSWRSSAKQAQLYAAFLAGVGNTAAPPGRSKHEKVAAGKPAAQACDLRYPSTAAKAWIHDHAADYGLRFPVRGEDWHVELAKGAPKVKVPPAAPERPATNVPPGDSPLLGLQNPPLYGPKVADVHRALIKMSWNNRARLGDDVELERYGQNTALVVGDLRANRGKPRRGGVDEWAWAVLRKAAHG